MIFKAKRLQNILSQVILIITDNYMKGRRQTIYHIYSIRRAKPNCFSNFIKQISFNWASSQNVHEQGR